MELGLFRSGRSNISMLPAMVQMFWYILRSRHVAHVISSDLDLQQHAWFLAGWTSVTWNVHMVDFYHGH